MAEDRRMTGEEWRQNSFPLLSKILQCSGITWGEGKRETGPEIERDRETDRQRQADRLRGKVARRETRQRQRGMETVCLTV